MPNRFKHRSLQSEMLDAPNIPKELLFQNLDELDFINRVSGGHAISMNGIKKLVSDKNKVYHIVDLGCGSGGTMKRIADWARAEGYQVRLTGVDKNSDVILYLNYHCKGYPEISGIVSDYLDFLKTGGPFDIVHCSLFCHHLNDEELAVFFNWLKYHAKTGFVINDLHRHWLAYYGVQLITRLLNGSALSKNDGPVSVLRAFRREELFSLLRTVRINNFSITWSWAFRYLVIATT